MQLREPLTLRDAASTRELTSQSIHVRATTANLEARTVDAVLATEVVAQVNDWCRGEVIDEVLSLDGAEYGEQVPLLDSHNRFSSGAIRGAVRNIRREGNDLVCTLHFAGDQASIEAFDKVRGGFITDISAGYRVLAFEELTPGTTRKINGKTYTAGKRHLRVSTQWTVREGSLVAIGADPNAKIREQPGEGPQKRTTAMDPKLLAYLHSIGLRAEATTAEAHVYYTNLTGAQRAHADEVAAKPGDFLDDGVTRAAAAPAADPAAPRPPSGAGGDGPGGQRSVPDPPPAPPAPPAPLVTDPEAIRAAERQRIAEIQDLRSDNTPDEVITRAISEGMSVQQASHAILMAQRNARSGGGGQGAAPAMHTRQESQADQAQALGAGLCLRAGLDYTDLNANMRGSEETVRAAQERLATMGDRYSDMSLVDYARTALSIEGQNVPHNRSEMIRAAVSTATLSHVFTSSVLAHVVQGYSTAADSTRVWAEEGDVTDFKTNKDITLGKTSGMKKLARGGTAPHATIDDEAETYKVARYAEQWAIDEQDIIDDMMNLLTELPAQLSEEAAQLRPDLIYSILLANPNMADGTDLFHANHANLGSGAAMSQTVMAAAITAMAKQTRGGRNLNLQPGYLIVPQDLKFTSRQILESAELREAVAANGTKNPIADEDIRLVSENRIGAAGVTDPDTKTSYTGTATNFFLAAQRRTVKAVYRSGTNRRPQVRRFVLDRGQWGIGWDINLDIGAFARDHRGLRKEVGA